MPLLTLLQSSATFQSLQFVDETGTNPLPAGIQISIYGGSVVSPVSLVGTTNIMAGRFTNIALQPGGYYTATFTGTQAPSSQCYFYFESTGLTLGVVNGYRSPCLSTAGYAAEQTNLWPKGPAWFSDAAKAPGGNAYPVAYGIGGILSALDSEAQYELGRMRLQTCQGNDIDTWANDFLGSYFTRPTGATDAQWKTLIYACLQTPKMTLAGIQTIITAWLPWIISGFSPPPGLFLDTSGSLDDAGGFLDVSSTSLISGYPEVLVFDAQSNPALAQQLKPQMTTTSCQFCVYFQYPIALGTGTIQIVRPLSPLLSTITNLWKASGTIPVYAVNI